MIDKELRNELLKEKDEKKLDRLIRKYALYYDKEILEHFNEICTDNTWTGNFYLRKK